MSGSVSFESAVTVLSRSPSPPPLLSISACVTVCEHVYTHVSVSCSCPSPLVSPVGPLIAEVQFGSETVTPVSVWLPVLVTVNVYGTT